MLNILIVEDNYEDMEYCAALLLTIRKDINLFKAGTGQKTLEVLEKSNMDVVFLDVRLPDFSGFTLASKIGEMKGRRLTKIIFITAEQHNQLEVYRKFHCYDYISKPFSPETFVSIVNPLLEGIEDQKASTPEPRVDVIILENRYDRYIVEKKDVLFVESMGRVINVYCRAQVIEGNRWFA